MKRIKYLISFLFLVINIQCTEKEYVDVDVNPQLEISVIDINGNAVNGVTVKLFQTEDDLISKENEVQTKTADSEGKVVFEDLNEEVYYFYAEKGELNNYFDIVTFSKPLENNQILTITCTIK